MRMEVNPLLLLLILLLLLMLVLRLVLIVIGVWHFIRPVTGPSVIAVRWLPTAGTRCQQVENGLVRR